MTAPNDVLYECKAPCQRCGLPCRQHSHGGIVFGRNVPCPLNAELHVCGHLRTDTVTPPNDALDLCEAPCLTCGAPCNNHNHNGRSKATGVYCQINADYHVCAFPRGRDGPAPPPSTDWMLLNALEYSNAVTDLVVAVSASNIYADDDDLEDHYLESIRIKCCAGSVAAFICWASGGAYAIRRES